jgi:KDO2-lipid IV(A) lauroyltransferase
VFGHRYSEREVARIAWLSWRNFVFTAIDLVRLPWMTLDWIQSHVEGWQEAKAKVEKHHVTGKGAVLATPHMGAWEVAAVAMQRFGMPIFILTGKQKNPLADAYINRLRGGTGITTIPRASNLLREVIRKLRQGGFLAFLPDVRAKTESLRIRFLGKDANVPAGMAVFAYQADVPIIFGTITRVGWSHHRLLTSDLVYPDRNKTKQEEWQRITQEIFSRIEAAIREQPEQWFWYNKRWILDPLEPDSGTPNPKADEARSDEPASGG